MNFADIAKTNLKKWTEFVTCEINSLRILYSSCCWENWVFDVNADEEKEVNFEENFDWRRKRIRLNIRWKWD